MGAVAVENVGFYRNFEYQRGRRECAFFKSVTYLRYDFGRLRFACGKIYADGKILKADIDRIQGYYCSRPLSLTEAKTVFTESIRIKGC